jgi:hypothetical protein
MTILKTFALLILVILTASCDKPIQNPETTDPIYSDLEVERKNAAAAADSEKTAIADLDKEIEAAPPRDPGKKKAMRDREARLKNLVQLKQKALYFEIRLEQRKKFDEIDYLKAYEKKEPWPNPAEFTEYKASKKLKTASRNWEERVPKTDRYSKKTEGAPGAKKEEKKAEGGAKKEE